MRKQKWAYGVTTVPERATTTLPKTLESLAHTGFDKPRLFVDGSLGDLFMYPGYETTFRQPSLGPYGNWVLALAELYIREPTANRYAIFQDDILAVGNLRGYLDRCSFPEKGYWNLFTSQVNEDYLSLISHPITGREIGPRGWVPSDQRGRGALALVFDRDGVQQLLVNQGASVKHMVCKAASANIRFRYQNIDGGVIEAMHQAQWREWVHAPSLVQHIGATTSIGSRWDSVHPVRPPSVTFPGEGFDAMEFLQKQNAAV